MITTRLQLREGARAMADQDGATFPTDAQVNDAVNRAADAVWRRMVSVGWRPTGGTLFLNANSAGPAFPFTVPVATVDNVFPCASGTSPLPIGPALRRIKAEELLSFQSGSPPSAPSDFSVAYELSNGAASGTGLPSTFNSNLVITLFPSPTKGFYCVFFVPQFPGFTLDADVWTGPAGSSDLIILQAGIEGAAKEDNDLKVNTLERQLKRKWDEVIESAGFQDAQGQQTVRDVRRNRYRPGDFFASDGWDDWS